MINLKVNVSTQALEKYAEVVQARLPSVVKKNCYRIAGKAADDCPVDTGFGKSTLAEGSKEITPLKWKVEDGTDYLIYQELGTSRGIPAKHFLGRACETIAPDFFDDVAGALKA